MRVALTLTDTAALVGWILSVGIQVLVIGPDELKEKVEKEAEKILRS